MTAKIAENLVDSNVTINKSIFTAAWEYVDEKGKKTLMFKCLSILEAADFENCFSELSQWYSGFCDRSKKHSVPFLSGNGREYNTFLFQTVDSFAFCCICLCAISSTSFSNLIMN